MRSIIHRVSDHAALVAPGWCILHKPLFIQLWVCLVITPGALLAPLEKIPAVLHIEGFSIDLWPSSGFWIVLRLWITFGVITAVSLSTDKKILKGCNY